MLQSIRTRLPVSALPQHVFIIGAQKAGTTALHAYLADHPAIICGAEKELGFFHRDALYGKGFKSYRYMFPLYPKGTHALDATPENRYPKKRLNVFMHSEAMQK